MLDIFNKLFSYLNIDMSNWDRAGSRNNKIQLNNESIGGTPSNFLDLNFEWSGLCLDFHGNVICLALK